MPGTVRDPYLPGICPGALPELWRDLDGSRRTRRDNQNNYQRSAKARVGRAGGRSLKLISSLDARRKESNMAESPVFYYETEVEGKKEKGGQIGGWSLPAVTVGAPPEFKGREGIWSPEQLFVASLNTCYMLTFLAIAENSKVALVSFSSLPRVSSRKPRGAV